MGNHLLVWFQNSLAFLAWKTRKTKGNQVFSFGFCRILSGFQVQTAGPRLKQEDMLGKNADLLGQQVDLLGQLVDLLGQNVDCLDKNVDSLVQQVECLDQKVDFLGKQRVVFLRQLIDQKNETHELITGMSSFGLLA